MPKPTKKKKTVKAYAVFDTAIDRYWENEDLSFYAIFPYKKMAVEYNKTFGPQKIIPVTITYYV